MDWLNFQEISDLTCFKLIKIIEWKAELLSK